MVLFYSVTSSGEHTRVAGGGKNSKESLSMEDSGNQVCPIVDKFLKKLEAKTKFHLSRTESGCNDHFGQSAELPDGLEERLVAGGRIRGDR